MTKLNEYFDNELSAQEQLEIQMWLAEHGDSPDAEAQLAGLFDSQHIDDDAAARAAFGRVAHRLGIAGGQPAVPSRRARIVTWSQRIAAVLVVPLLCAVWLLYADRKPDAEWLEQQVPCGETASLTLPDGTQLHLNSGSRITYPSAFTGRERRIFVEGEIFADVPKTPANRSSSSRAKSASGSWEPDSTSSPTPIPTASRCCWSKAPSGSTSTPRHASSSC